MNTTSPTERPRGAPTGKQYTSVKGLMQGESIPESVREKVAHLISESNIATKLAQLRHHAGITQQKMAEELQVTQPTISKIESGRDDELTLKQIKEYARVTGDRIGMMFGKPLSHVDSVRLHAIGLKTHLEELAKMAVEKEETQNEVRRFFAEAFANLFQIMALCNHQLPRSGGEGGVEIVFQNITKQITSHTHRSVMTSEENPEMQTSRFKTEAV